MKIDQHMAGEIKNGGNRNERIQSHLLSHLEIAV